MTWEEKKRKEWKKNVRIKAWYALRKAKRSLFDTSDEILKTEDKEQRGRVLGKLEIMERLIEDMILDYSDELYMNWDIDINELLKEEISNCLESKK